MSSRLMIASALALRSGVAGSRHAQLSVKRPGVARVTHWTPRTFATRTEVDNKIEEITELYATAKDEFDMAAEETEKKTVYAEADRAVAREELDKLKTAYETAVNGEGGSEIQKRIGHRLRELENAVKAMEERAMED